MSAGASRMPGSGSFGSRTMTTHDDYAGLARVADALRPRLQAASTSMSITPFRHMLEHRSVDIVMIDQVRSGGITPWLKIAGMAEAFNLPVVSHGVPEIHVHLVGAVPNGLTVEYMPRLFHLLGVGAEAQGRASRHADRPRPSVSNSTRPPLGNTGPSARSLRGGGGSSSGP